MTASLSSVRQKLRCAATCACAGFSLFVADFVAAAGDLAADETLNAPTLPALHVEKRLLEEVMIIGDREAVMNVSGSSALIDSDQIRDELATDINQLLKTVPGTYIREEDGYGLRPNIGIPS